MFTVSHDRLWLLLFLNSFVWPRSLVSRTPILALSERVVEKYRDLTVALFYRPATISLILGAVRVCIRRNAPPKPCTPRKLPRFFKSGRTNVSYTKVINIIPNFQDSWITFWNKLTNKITFLFWEVPSNLVFAYNCWTERRIFTNEVSVPYLQWKYNFF